MSLEIKSNGAGKYDPLLTIARGEAMSNNAVLLIMDGVYGGGFSVQVEPRNLKKLPDLLRDLADAIQADIDASALRGDLPNSLK